MIVKYDDNNYSDDYGGGDVDDDDDDSDDDDNNDRDYNCVYSQVIPIQTLQHETLNTHCYVSNITIENAEWSSRKLHIYISGTNHKLS